MIELKFETTLQILEVLKPYTENSDISIKTDHTDYIILDKKNDIGFEVFDNEIIVYYFTDHSHFEDYTSELDKGEDNYITRAKDFLIKLFTQNICKLDIYKGKSLVSEKYYLIYNDDRGDEFIGGTVYSLIKLINPFFKKTTRRATRQFDKSKGCFTNRQPKPFDSEAIEVIDFNENCYIEIYKNNNSYTYSVMELVFDDYFGIYYWTQNINIPKSGLYDTKENAVNSAIKELNVCFKNLSNIQS